MQTEFDTMSQILTDRHDEKADRIALAAIRGSLRKLRMAAENARRHGQRDAATDTDRVADALGNIAAEIQQRIECAEVW
jgi:hypothetical protein